MTQSEVIANPVTCAEAAHSEPTYEDKLQEFWGETVLRHGNWWQFSNCKDKDPEIFGQGGAAANSYAAKLVCKGCSVQNECLAEALERSKFEDGDGVWGGLTKRQRSALRKEIQNDPLAARKLMAIKRQDDYLAATQELNKLLEDEDY